jgi:hypothetical protein
MKTVILNSWLVLVGLLMTTSLIAQEAKAEKKLGWEKGASIGLDFTQLLQVNPKQGAGQNRLGFGSATTFFATKTGERHSWENLASWQFGLQRLGTGVIAQGTNTTKIPFQKSIDELRLNSKYGYQVKKDSKFFYAGLFNFVSQLTPTYQGTEAYPGNFITDVFDNALLNSKFFAPATAQLSLGIDYKPTQRLSLYYSPLGAKFIIVGDDDIARLGVHGNEVERNDMGVVTSFKNVDSQLGSTVRAAYTLGEESRVKFSSSLLLFSNYLRNPQNVDVDWNNALGYELFKNFQINLLLNVFYDDDMLMQITDFDAPGGVSGLGKRVSLTQQILLTYTRAF